MSLKNKKIGFIGLGTMGLPMAMNIFRAGYNLSVYNRTLEKAMAFRKQGLVIYQTPGELALNSDIIIMIVTGDDAVKQLLAGNHGVVENLTEGKIVINMSTNSRDSTRHAADIVNSKNCQFIDAPVSGSKRPAEEGSLVILAGGNRDLIEDLEPLFLTMGKKVVYCGEIGQGTRMKLMINMLLGGMMVSFCEALAFGKKMGLESENMLRTIELGAMNSPMLKVKGRAIMDSDFARNFSIDLLLKDLNLALAEGEKAGMPLTATAIAKMSFAAAKEFDLGDMDIAALIKYYEKIANIEISG